MEFRDKFRMYANSIHKAQSQSTEDSDVMRLLSDFLAESEGQEPGLNLVEGVDYEVIE